MSLTYSEKTGAPSTNPSSFGTQNPHGGVPRYGLNGERLEDEHPPRRVPRYGLNGERLDGYPPGTYPCCFGPNGERLHDYHPPGIVPESTPVELKKSGFSSALNSLISLRNYQHIREMAAEFLATMVFVAFGNGATAQWLLGFNLFGEWLSVAIGYGFGILFGYYICGGISGGHMNPAVTLALAVWRKFPWWKVPGYMLAQLVGGFVGAFWVWVDFFDALDAFDGGHRQVIGPQATAGIFANYPRSFLSTWNGFMDQFIGTMFLMIGVFALTDTRNVAPRPHIAGLYFGFLVLIIGSAFGSNSGFAINPARDLGPRLFTYAAGWGSQVWTAGNYYFWIPIIGPLVGGVFGGFLYELFVTWNYPSKKQVRKQVEASS